ncbi:MAG: Flavodoxin reductases (ferredoxin-NADPH reductases) family 1 [uncultured Nocardioidaceae bacterium]|uniref:Flavodoxin reductases (Ferredoxin-NADPH reductases) family 1 n=1 Tax=uncultured Nocardioidaceae bacterium TaxID=253824 RepID=A0A6J4LV14_9ACTN|nr:MAG: Flavodoxin reductases (ferredoxin-NADPH reductases) family 1 [uncultured Nocardioidaceae bacterium]
MLVGTVAEVWRHPVKSLGGERLDSCHVDARGLRMDRWWALRDPDGKLGSGKSTRRFRAMPGLLELSARLAGDRAEIGWPGASTVSSEDAGVDARLSEHVGRPVALAVESSVSHLDEAPVHLVTTASLDWLAQRHGSPVDVRRLRPNLLVATSSPRTEEQWVGRTVQVGAEVALRVTHRTERCVMTGQHQADLPADRGVLRTISAEADLCFGVHADVVRTGTVHAGDPVVLLDRDDPLHHAESLRA